MAAGTAARAVLVSGARGVLGGALVSAFEDAGWRVVRSARERGRRSRIRDNQQPVRRVFGGSGRPCVARLRRTRLCDASRCWSRGLASHEDQDRCDEEGQSDGSVGRWVRGDEEPR
jgi:nucleoside-diphosphate-sugar epimerase